MYDIITFAHLFKPHLGGLEKYIENFYTRLPNKKIIIITSRFDKSLKKQESLLDVDIIRIDSIEIIKDKYYIPSAKGLKQIKDILKKHRDSNTQVHTHTRFYLTNFFATYFAKKFNLSHYHFEHGSSFVQDGSFFVKTSAYIFDMTLARYILRNSKLIFPISESVREFLSTHYKNLVFGPTLYNSYDFKNKEFIKKPKPKIPKLLFVGRLVKSKGVYELLEAAKILKEKSFPYILTIIGDGSEREDMEKYVKENNLVEEIVMKGKLLYGETQKEYSKHDIFINPSYTEGLPTTVLEAIANSLLVVATDVGGTREIIPKDLLIATKTLSPKILSVNIIETVDSWREKQEKYNKIMQIVKNQFNTDNITKIYLSL